MATDLQEHHDVSMSELMTGIMDDVQELLKQQLALFKVELQRDLARTKDAGILVGVGAGLAAVATLLISLMLVYLLSWSVPSLPLWACFGIVGAALAAAGAAFVATGVQRLHSFNPLPDQSVRALVENVQCVTNPNQCLANQNPN
jgi:uncharacterized membrane protein YqjE